jgi:hypothetical protein
MLLHDTVIKHQFIIDVLHYVVRTLLHNFQETRPNLNKQSTHSKFDH